MTGISEDDFTFSNDAGDTLSGSVTQDIAGERFFSNSVVREESAVDFCVVEAQQYVTPAKPYGAVRFTNATND